MRTNLCRPYLHHHNQQAWLRTERCEVSLVRPDRAPVQVHHTVGLADPNGRAPMSLSLRGQSVIAATVAIGLQASWFLVA